MREVTCDAFGSVTVVAFAGFAVDGRCSLHLPVVAITVDVVGYFSGTFRVALALAVALCILSEG